MSPYTRLGRSRKKRQRGVAIVEALVASVLITTFLGATWFFHELHVRKSETMRLARYQAWVATRPECSRPAEGRGAATVQVPVTMQMVGAPPAMPVTSATDMACNVKPNPDSDILTVLGSITDLRPPQ